MGAPCRPGRNHRLRNRASRPSDMSSIETMLDEHVCHAPVNRASALVPGFPGLAASTAWWLQRAKMLLDRHVQSRQGLAFIMGRAVERIARAPQRVQQHTLQKRSDATLRLAARRQQAGVTKGVNQQEVKARSASVGGVSAAIRTTSSSDTSDRSTASASRPRLTSTSCAARNRGPAFSEIQISSVRVATMSMRRAGAIDPRGHGAQG